jgi:hypothetical protein
MSLYGHIFLLVVLALSCCQGTVKRIWCIFEFAWSINLNGGGCLFYAGFDDAAAAKLDEKTRTNLRDLVEDDKLRLQASDPTSMLKNASCFKKSDATFIRRTIKSRLNGEMQTCMIIQHQFRSVFGGSAASSDASSCHDALTAMFLKCNGPNWKLKRSWMDQEPLGEWDGIETDGSGLVVRKLDLQSNNVAGPVLDLAAYHAVFAGLSSINIEDNNANGTRDVRCVWWGIVA